jgi:cell division inhibitor SepF
MGFADVWNRTLVYFGIAEEDDDEWDEDGYVTEEELEDRYRERPNVRRLAPRRAPRGSDYDDWTDSSRDVSPTDRTAVRHERPARAEGGRAERERAERPRLRSVGGAAGAAAKVHLVIPRSFNDAQQVADKFKDGIPVILNLQSSDAELSKRLIDFGSGLTYALDGGMQRVADKVFLLTPRNVEVSAEERARIIERGGFFNQL